MVTNSNILGKNLKYLREKKGLSLVEMAELIDMEPNKLEQLEKGQNFEIDYLSVLNFYDGDMDLLFDKLNSEK